MTFDDIAWLPLCAGLTAVGVGLSYLTFRRRGVTAGLRATAWSLLPLAAYLTGALQTLWNVGAAVVGFVTGLVLSPAVWAGVVLAGLSALLFVVSGTLRGRALSRTRTARPEPGGGAAAPERSAAARTTAPQAATPKAATTKAVQTGKTAPRQVEQPAGDDFSDIEAILKRRGID
ncbi:cellulose synthase [Microbispora bryophytorum]|uniref:Cellulose synthase n=1 Tax=Microbispora bryophytorum subsp. camponoti TaxID=1677852 RepID=A0ABR8L6X4_9ACTN|nr:cellulose synthase [Microbispora camponoti]MBD3145427.1 cellulose synthase [Microbispora camponoti]